MAEPHSKRSRRPDSASMWDERSPRDRGHNAGRRDNDRRHRSRSRDRRDGRDVRDRDGRDRDGDRRRERSRSRDRRRRDDDRMRSRSPRDRDGPRRRSPPRGPRGGGGGASQAGAGNRSAPGGGRGAHGNSSGGRGSNTHANANANRPVADKPSTAMEVDGEGKGGEDAEEQLMNRLMGFSKFRSTKNTKVPGNDRNYAVRKEKKTEYRQYMNRVGGFNRPLSPSR